MKKIVLSERRVRFAVAGGSRFLMKSSAAVKNAGGGRTAFFYLKK